MLTDAMKSEYRIVVEAGPDRGKSFPIPETGCDLGRGTQNTVVINDGEASSRHCRIEFRNGELWVVDLCSTNGTYVNGVDINPETPVPGSAGTQDSRLSDGDQVRIGTTLLRIRKTPADAPAPPLPPPSSAPLPATEKPAAVDLGLNREKESRSADPASAKEARKTLLWSIAVALLLVLGAWVIRIIVSAPPETAVTPIREAPKPRVVAIHYTKLEADTNNLFRYTLSLETNGTIAVEIDDLAQSRHYRSPADKTVSADLLASLARGIEQTGFYSLDPLYEGIAPNNSERDYDLVVVHGADVFRVRVLNRVEPDAFRDARMKIETFVRNELGLWAIEFSSEQLREMAYDALLMGQRFLQECDIRDENLFEATRKFRECENLLETVEPKPDFFAEATEGRRESESILAERYRDLNFSADRAIKANDWPTAAKALSKLMRLVPVPGDPRYDDAKARLLDVDSRLDSHRRK